MGIESAPEPCDEPFVNVLFSVIGRLGIFGLLLDPELTIGQLRILFRLYYHDSLTIGQVAEMLSVSGPTATGIVNRLVARGLLGRVPDLSDQRLVRSQLSPRRLERVGALRCAGAERGQAVLTQLSPSQRTGLYQALEPLHQLLLTQAESQEVSAGALARE